ncbi:MAG: ABC transporter permease, partial [Olsenella sp.]|nr:ABC transporter permease [Olsenella sp.]
GSQLSGAIAGQLAGQMSSLTSALREGFSFDADAFANAIHFNMTQEDLTSLLTNYMNAAELTYDSNMSRLGYASADSPESISIYPKDFAAKQSVLDVIDAYNREKDAQGQHDATIQYSDIAGALMSSVTDIVNMVSMVLIAFVSISLVVSSIMIGIITYISVLERKKEIGILRAMGASKLNVANVFNAETIIEGLIAGVFAILTVVLLSIPVNAIVLETQGVADIMILPWASGLVLIGVSVLLTFLGGLLPSTRASKNDPVEALRSE